jgi:hypothetical protein
MTRTNFLKRLGIAILGVVVAKPIIDALPNIPNKYVVGFDPFYDPNAGIERFTVRFSHNWLYKNPLTYAEVYRIGKDGNVEYIDMNGNIIDSTKPNNV